MRFSGLGLRLEALMFGGLRFSVWRIWGFEVLGFEDFEVLRAFGRTRSCSTSLPGGNQVDGLPPGVHFGGFTIIWAETQQNLSVGQL